MADTLGTIYLALGMDIKEFVKGGDEAKKKLQKMFKDIGNADSVKLERLMGIAEAMRALQEFEGNFKRQNTLYKRFGSTRAEFIKKLEFAEQAANQRTEEKKRKEDEKTRAKREREFLRLLEKEEKATARAIAKEAKDREEAQREFTRQINSLGMLNTGGTLKQVWNLMASYISLRSVGTFLKDIVRITGEFELQQTSLAAIVQDAQKAGTIFRQIKELAVQSPFQFKDLVTFVRQLSAYSIPTDELFETTKMLADVSAGLGVDMNRIVLAYGQIRSASFLRGQEVRQLTEAGIPILTELAKQFEEVEGRVVSAAEVFDKISSRQVTFDMVEKVFKNMTEEGGKFYQMQEIQAQTLKGMVSNLVDAYQIMVNDMGSNTSGILKGGVNAVMAMIENWRTWLGLIATSVASLTAMKSALMFISLLSKDVAINSSKLTGIIGRLKTELNTIQKIWVAMSASQKMSLGIAGAIVAIAGVLAVVYNNLTKLNKELKKIREENFSNANSTAASFQMWTDRLNAATEGSQKYRDAISKINSSYGEYLSNLMHEADSYDLIAIKANGAREAIYKKNAEQALEESRVEIAKSVGTEKARMKMAKAVAGGEKADMKSEFSANQFSLNYEQAIRSLIKEENFSELEPAVMYNLFNKVFKDVFSDWYGVSFSNRIKSWAKGGSGVSSSMYLELANSLDYATDYAKKIMKEEKRIAEESEEISILFTGFGNFLSEKELTARTDIEDAYREKEELINNSKLSPEDAGEQIRLAKVEAEKKFIDLYKPVYEIVITENGEPSTKQLSLEEVTNMLNSPDTAYKEDDFKQINEFYSSANYQNHKAAYDLLTKAPEAWEVFAKKWNIPFVSSLNQGTYASNIDDQVNEYHKAITNLAMLPAEHMQERKEFYQGIISKYENYFEDFGVPENVWRANKDKKSTKKPQSDIEKIEINSWKLQAKELLNIVKTQGELRGKTKDLKGEFSVSDEELFEMAVGLQDKKVITKAILDVSVTGASDDFLEILKGSEDFVAEAYQAKYKDINGKEVEDVLTIGYGHTGNDVTKGMKIDEKKALELFGQDVAKAEAPLLKALEDGLEISQGWYEAILDIAYNAGSEHVDGLVAKYKEFRAKGDMAGFKEYYDGYAVALRNDTSTPKKKQPGLIKRRGIMSSRAMIAEDMLLSPESANKEIKSMEDITTAILKISAKLRAAGDVTGAQNLESQYNSLAVNDATSEVSKVFEDAKNLQDFMSDLKEQDWFIKGSGASFNISKVASDYRSKGKKMNSSYINAGEWLEGIKEQYPDLYEETKVFLQNSHELQKSYEKKIHEEKLANLGQEYAAELMQKKGIFKEGETNFDRLSKLSIGTIDTYLDGIQELIEQLDNGELDDALKAMLGDAGLDIEAIKKKMKEFFGGKYSDNLIEKTGRIKKTFTEIMSGLSNVSQSLSELGEVKDDEGLKSIAKTFDNIKDVVSDMAGLIIDAFKDGAKTFGEAFKNIAKSSDWITMIVKVVLEAISALMDYSTETLKFESEVRVAQKEWIHMLSQIRIEALLAADATSTIFGDDKLSQIQSWRDAANEALSEMAKRKTAYTKWVFREFNSYGNVSRDAEPREFRVYTKKNASSYLKDIVPELYNEDDSINYEYLEKFVGSEWYNKLTTDEQRQFFDEQLELWNQYKEAIDNINQSIADMFGDLSEEIADKMINAFVRTGDAATDLGDTVSNVANTVVKDLISSVLIQQLADPIAKIQALWGVDNTLSDEERLKESMAIIDNAMSSVGEKAGQFNELLAYIQDNYGLSSSNSSDNMISGVTEDTAQLLASYINAIRADVAMQKYSIITEIAPAVTNISSIINESYIQSIRNIESYSLRTAIAVENALDRFSMIKIEKGALLVTD